MANERANLIQNYYKMCVEHIDVRNATDATILTSSCGGIGHIIRHRGQKQQRGYKKNRPPTPQPAIQTKMPGR